MVAAGIAVVGWVAASVGLLASCGVARGATGASATVASWSGTGTG